MELILSKEECIFVCVLLNSKISKYKNIIGDNSCDSGLKKYCEDMIDDCEKLLEKFKFKEGN